jgi:outer membrane protein
MMNKLFVFLWVLTTFPPIGLHALTIEEALTEAMTNNRDYQIIRNKRIQAENTKILGLTKLFPTLDASVDVFEGRQDNIQVGNPNFAASGSRGLSTQLTANWILFDGFQTWATKSLVEEEAELALLQEVEQKRLIQLEVKVSYFQTFILQQLYQWWEDQYKSTHKRFKADESRWNLGSLSKLNYLQSKIALRRDSSSLMNQKLQLSQSWNDLNLLMGRDSLHELSELTSVLDEDHLTQQSVNRGRNLQIEIMDKKIKLAQQNARSVFSAYYPRLIMSGRTGYEYGENDNIRNGTFISEVSSQQIGLQLRWNIFSGLQTTMNYRNAKLNQANVTLLHKDQKIKLDLAIELANKNLELLQNQILITQQSYEMTRELYQAVRAAFDLGSMSVLDLDKARLDSQLIFIDLQQLKFNYLKESLQLEYLLGHDL